ncbi:M20 family metallopeptidase [Spelaeicoccus albus]|uniref:Peptidase M20 domain-containing protein 2 n=1 Tax=Spelaeicoccus albus TaxID=1280376 RepID=A0A7Z0D0D6_9MICO|nr:M20 family metallopeptidase [Spelaeicoccus albus]NYI67226.1 amidohydrolase [Spelaeicoccus albus]
MSDFKEAARESIDSRARALIELSQRLHDSPEIGWHEFDSSRDVAEVLAGMGFGIERGYLGLPTALRATYGAGPFRIGLMAEYDALPGLGHACGHNLITAMSVGAAYALAQVADAAGLTVEVYGTPAEEGGGGKIEMLERGAFAGLDLAMMAHPAPVDVAEARPFAVAHSHIEYVGKAAHAAAFPTLGINAADAFTIAQTSIALLRQQLPPTVRVHGVMTNAGEAPNAIPERTEGRWYVRAASLAELDDVQERVEKCFHAGALATGCELTITPESKPYAEFRTDRAALDFYRANAETLGRKLESEGPATQMATASTDMGNVSQIVPAIHPYIGVDSFPVLNHQKEFADHCIGLVAEKALLDGATALAWTALDMASA